MGAFSIAADAIGKVVKQISAEAAASLSFVPSVEDPTQGILTVPDKWMSVIETAMQPPNLSGAALQVLIDYASIKQTAAMAQGLSVNLGTSGQPSDVSVSTDAASIALLNGIARQATTNPAYTVNWVSSGVGTILSAGQILAIDTAVTAFVQKTFDALMAAVARIRAGTITTVEEIDAIDWLS